jgi:AAA15 family ATPase/GTPase
MQATKLKSRDTLMDDNAIFEANGHRLLKCSAIYGANASGKSNVVRAMDSMKKLLFNSMFNFQAIDVEPFALNVDTENSPSEFEVLFLIDGILYRYGFRVTAKVIVSEWLYHTPNKKELMLFERDGQVIRIQNKTFKEGKGLQEKTRDNVLFLTVVAQFNGQIALKILLWFMEFQILAGIKALDSNILSIDSLNSLASNFNQKIIDFIKSFDTDIHDIFVVKKENDDESSEYPEIKTKHPLYSNNGKIIGFKLFDLYKHESEGTKKIFGLAYYILKAIQNGGILVIDEFDARLHPRITREIVNLFNSKDANPNNAQFIFITHDTNLLDYRLLRRDQIWFVKKNRYSSSELYSLSDLKIRNDASFEQEYITGRYGAIPFVNRISLTLENIMEKGEEYGKGSK